MPRSYRSLVLAVVVGMSFLVLPARASAQVAAIGARISFVRGDVATDTPSSQLLGGLVRLKASPRIAVEGSMDYRSYTSTDKTKKVRETPIQGSLLLYLIHTTISPYVLGGYGIYTQKTDTLATNGSVTASASEKKTGVHAGFGADLMFGKHAAVFADYRYRFVRFGSKADATAQPLIPGVGLTKFSHQGSMWTGGLALYF